jgi:integrase
MPANRRTLGRRGLAVVSRPGTRILYLRGTVRGCRVFESTGTDDPGLAEEARAAREAELYRAAVLGTKPTMTFAAAALAYLEHQPRHASTKYDLGRLVAHLGSHITCREIDQEVIDHAQQALCRPDSKPVTRHKRVTIPASAVLNFAARRGRCDRPNFETPKAGARRTEWLTPDEAERLVTGVSQRSKRLRPLLEFLLCTGCRLDEALALEWSAVNLQHARVTFRGHLEDGTPGTKSRVDRVYDLPARAIAALANLPGPRQGRVFRKRGDIPYRRTSETKEGKWTGGGQIKRAFATAVENAGITRHISPHVLRHTWATWHYCVHRDPMRLRDEGGWHSIWMVERYAKLTPATMRPEVLAFWGVTGPVNTGESATDLVQSAADDSQKDKAIA